jgi:hypothetical protein
MATTRPAPARDERRPEVIVDFESIELSHEGLRLEL